MKESIPAAWFCQIVINKQLEIDFKIITYINWNRIVSKTYKNFWNCKQIDLTTKPSQGM